MTCEPDVRRFTVVKLMAQKNGSRKWTTGELRILRENAKLGALSISLVLGRSVCSVRHMAKRQRISLRATGERRGLVLGQARGLSLVAAIREDIVSGKVDAEVLARRMALDRGAARCPCCGHRPVEVSSSGFCLKCHRDLLIEAHLRELEKLDSQKSLWSSRQALCRARKAAEA